VSARSAGLATLIAIIWGLCFILIQASLPSPAPLLLAALRALIGGGVVVAWVASGRRRPAARPPAGQSASGTPLHGLPSIALLFTLAFTNAVLGLGAMYLAAGRAEAAVASILAGGQPLILAAAGWGLFGERLSRRTVAGLAVAMIGVVLVATTSSGATSLDGVALALLAAVSPVAGTVLMRRLAPSIDLLGTTGAQFLLGGTILLAVSALLEPWRAVSWSPTILAGLLVLGVLGTGLAYVAWFWLLGHVSLVRLGAALFLVPVTGVVAAIVTGDRPGPVDLAGMAALLVGLAIVTFGGASSGPEEPARQTA
jgi:drug/metabolite transporter (DMT)-like permease